MFIWLNSATRLVLVMVFLSLCVGLFTGQVDMQSFKELALLVAGAFFGQKISEKTTATVEKKDEIKVVE